MVKRQRRPAARPRERTVSFPLLRHRRARSGAPVLAPGDQAAVAVEMDGVAVGEFERCLAGAEEPAATGANHEAEPLAVLKVPLHFSAQAVKSDISA